MQVDKEDCSRLPDYLWRFKEPEFSPPQQQLQALRDGEYNLLTDEADLYKLMKLARTNSDQERVRKQLEGMGFVAIQNRMIDRELKSKQEQLQQQLDQRALERRR